MSNAFDSPRQWYRVSLEDGTFLRDGPLAAHCDCHCPLGAQTIDETATPETDDPTGNPKTLSSAETEESTVSSRLDLLGKGCDGRAREAAHSAAGPWPEPGPAPNRCQHIKSHSNLESLVLPAPTNRTMS